MDREPGRCRVMILELDLQYTKQSYMKNFSSICQRTQEKSAENVYFQYSKSQKGHFSYKNWYPLTTLEVDLKYSKTKSCVKFQLNMSKREREKCRKLYLQYSKFEKRHNSKIDANWRHSNLICSTEKQSYMQISAQYVKGCKRKVRKTVYFQYSKFEKGHNSNKNWPKLTTLELDL